MSNIHGLKGVINQSIQRSAKSWHHTPVLLIGHDKILGDLELLLEDTWKDLRHAESEEEAAGFLQKWTPRVAILGLAGTQNDTWMLHMLETSLRSISVRGLMCHEKMDRNSHRFLARRATISGIHLLEAESDPHQLASSMNDFLFGILEKGLASLDPLAKQLITAKSGFTAGIQAAGGIWNETKTENLLVLGRFLLGQFRLGTEVAEASEIYLQTYDMWRSEVLFEEDILSAKKVVEEILSASDSPIMQIIDLAAQTRDHARNRDTLTRVLWENAITTLKIGTLTKRHLNSIYDDLMIVCRSLKYSNSQLSIQKIDSAS